MGQKTNPIGNRLGIVRGWESNWFGGKKKEFGEKVVEDEKIRVYLRARVNKGGISKIVIERTLRRITVTIHTARPGIIIGKGGQEVDKIREELKKLTNKDVQINIVEIRKPELDAYIVGETIAKQIESRINYRRAIKMAIQSTMRTGGEGIKVRISGRLNGADMARSEEFKEGRTPLHTFRADIDYAHVEADTVYGKIGLKIWVFKGEVLGKRDLSMNVGVVKKEGGRGGNEGGGREQRGERESGGRRDGGNNNRRDGGGGGGRRDGGNNNRRDGGSGGGGRRDGGNNNRSGGGGGRRD